MDEPATRRSWSRGLLKASRLLILLALSAATVEFSASAGPQPHWHAGPSPAGASVASSQGGRVQTVANGEVLRVQGGSLVARRPDGASRQLFSESDVLRQSGINRMLDWKRLPGGKVRVLVIVGTLLQRTDAHTPDAGSLWLLDGDGRERFIASDAARARLSADGTMLLYTTTTRTVMVETHDGHTLRQLPRAYSPNWRPDGRAIVLSRAREDSSIQLPERLGVETFDVVTGASRQLTHGEFDDVRPEFHPSAAWVLFVSGGRTGFASFWRVSAAGGEPIQLTNIGAQSVDERFVPTPFQRTIWSSDGRWFVYDFKSGPREEVWALEFSTSGTLIRALAIAQGLDPQWVVDGSEIAVQQTADGVSQTVIIAVPR